MNVDKLMVVAHPDDDILWGGMNLLSQPGWFVVCATNLSNPIRSVEFYKSMSFTNVTKFIMFDVEDRYTDDPEESDSLFSNSMFENALKQLSTQTWKLVLTHSNTGEYTHEHHKTVSRMVLKYFPSAKTFAKTGKLEDWEIEWKRDSLVYYKTQSSPQLIYTNRINDLDSEQTDWFKNEYVYLELERKIPKLIHQIWFGGTLDPTSFRATLIRNVEAVAKRNGYVYKLWTNDDFKQDNFPLTWEYMQKSLDAGKRFGTVRYAQVADLARYELLHRFGGIYLDSLFEIGDTFCQYIQKHSKKELIVANEDPCKLNCKGGAGKYVSNGFFACVPGCVQIRRLLHPKMLDNIDFEEQRINRTTGPYFFRKGIRNKDKRVHVIETEKIYPFMVNDSAYRKGSPNTCVDADNKYIEKCLEKKYPNSLAVYQSGFGGSWSW